ncbi:MAG: M48 family metallopeptidase [archaeon]
MRKVTFEHEGKTYSLFIHNEARDDMRVSLGKTGVHLRIPSDISRDEYFRQVMHAKEWAKQRISNSPEIRDKGWKEYHSGDALTVGDKTYTLQITQRPARGSAARIVGSTIELRLSSQDTDAQRREATSVLLSRLIGGSRLPALQQRVKTLNEQHFQFRLGKISFKYSISRWGSCSKSGNVNLSTRLLFAPDDVLDYVCIHELAHLREHNHSPAFWKLVETAMPDYKEKEQWLKEHGDACWF